MFAAAPSANAAISGHKSSAPKAVSSKGSKRKQKQGKDSTAGAGGKQQRVSSSASGGVAS